MILYVIAIPFFLCFFLSFLQHFTANLDLLGLYVIIVDFFLFLWFCSMLFVVSFSSFDVSLRHFVSLFNSFSSLHLFRFFPFLFFFFYYLYFVKYFSFASSSLFSSNLDRYRHLHFCYLFLEFYVFFSEVILMSTSLTIYTYPYIHTYLL
jgi:hypothetical protein